MTKHSEKEYYGKLSKANLNHAIGKPYTDHEAGILIAQMAAALEVLPNPPARLLDLGCGTGWTSKFFAEAGYDVVGYDLSIDAIELASKHAPSQLKSRLTFMQGDFENLPYNKDFDLVLFIDSLHHSEDEEKVLSQVYDVLKPGGICVAIEPGLGHAKTIQSLEAIKNYGVIERDMPPRHMKRVAKKIGFINVRSYPHPGQIFRTFYKPVEKFTGKKKLLLQYPVIRFMAIIHRTTLDRYKHGMVTMQKPHPES